MNKGTHFFGQPVYGQLIKCLDKDKIIEMSRNHGGERYVKSFDGWHHLLTMLYAVILRFDSLREIEASMLAEVRKLGHLGLKTIPRRSTLSDANSRRSEKFFEDVYRDLYEANKVTLSSDSRRSGAIAQRPEPMCGVSEDDWKCTAKVGRKRQWRRTVYMDGRRGYIKGIGCMSQVVFKEPP